MNREFRRWAAVLATAGVVAAAMGGAAQAAVVLSRGSVHAEATAEQRDSGGTSTGAPSGFVVVNCALLSPCNEIGWGSILRRQTTSDLGAAGSVLADQDRGGYFLHRHELSLVNFGAGIEQVSGLARTEHEVRVTATTPDTPLLLDVMWLGGLISAGSYYGLGDLRLSMRVSVLVERGLDPMLPVWGFDDEIVHAAGSASPQFTANSTTVDVQGAGLPVRSFETEWREMMVWGDLRREAFFTTLDLGVLQPGEFLTLRYEAESTALLAGVPYAARALIDLEDPFGLQRSGPLIALRGLAAAPVGDTGGTVPEPASLGLALAALVAGSRRFVRCQPEATMRPRCRRSPG